MFGRCEPLGLGSSTDVCACTSRHPLSSVTSVEWVGFFGIVECPFESIPNSSLFLFSCNPLSRLGLRFSFLTSEDCLGVLASIFSGVELAILVEGEAGRSLLTLFLSGVTIGVAAKVAGP